MELNMKNKCSELFEDIFDSRSGCLIETCTCGITWFNKHDYNFYDKGEFEKLLEQEIKNPNKFIGVDHSVGTILINGTQIVIGCKCDNAYKWEQFIIKHDEQIAEYLNKRAKLLREKAKSIEVKKNDNQ